MRLRFLALPLALAAAGTAPTAAAQTFTGRLEAGDGTLETGEYRDVHRVTVRRGQHVRASLSARDFDPYVLMRGAARADDDDSGDGLDALATAVATESGDLRVTVTSAQAGETGAYRLVVAVQDGPFDEAPPARVETPGSGGGEGRPTVFAGELRSGDSALPSGEFADVHTARVRPGQHVRIDMASPTFDTYLIVSGAVAAQNDDIEPGRTMSRVEGVAGGDGQLRIVATSARTGETGAYLITVTAQDGPFPDGRAGSDVPEPEREAAGPAVQVELPAGGRRRIVEVSGFPGASLRLEPARAGAAVRFQRADIEREQPWSTGAATRAFSALAQERFVAEATQGTLPPLRATYRGLPAGVARYTLAAGLTAVRQAVESGGWRNAAFRFPDLDYYLLPILVDELVACQGYPKADGRFLAYCQIGFDAEADARAFYARLVPLVRSAVQGRPGTYAPRGFTRAATAFVGTRGDVYTVRLSHFERADVPFWGVAFYANGD